MVTIWHKQTLLKYAIIKKDPKKWVDSDKWRFQDAFNPVMPDILINSKIFFLLLNHLLNI